MHSANDIYVVGGGPSLIGFDWSRLDGKQVIAVNAAYRVLPRAQRIFFSDAKFYEWNAPLPEWKQHTGRKCTTCRRGVEESVEQYRHHNPPLSDDPQALAGNCSGSRALNLAWHDVAAAGAGSIYLLGFDMRPNGNFHDYHLLANRQGHYESHFVPGLERMGKALLDRGVKVINACADSALTVFPRISLSELPC